MADQTLEIVVSEGDVAATVEAIEAALPDTATVVPSLPPTDPLADAVHAATAAAADLPAVVSNWWSSTRAADGIDPALTFVLFAIIFGAAYLVERFARVFIQNSLNKLAPADPSFVDRLRAAGRWAVVQILSIFVFVGVSYAAIALITDTNSGSAALASTLFASILRLRILLLLFGFLTAPAEPGRRLTGLTEEEAKYLMRMAVVFITPFVAFNFLRDFIVTAVDARESGALLATFSVIVDFVVAAAFFYAIRKPVARIIKSRLAGGAPDDSSEPFVARSWHFIYAALFGLNCIFRAKGYLIVDQGGATAATSYSFQIFILTPFIIAGLRIWRDEALAQTEIEKRGFVVGTFAFIEGAVIVLAAILVLLAWQIDPFASDATGIRRIVPGLVTAALAIVVGLSIWRTIDAFLDMYAPESDADDGMPSEGEGGGPGGSRLETVFPILRGFAIATIATITVMVALSALGVQIGPLIASAGVIGLAVGFGAQTLVKDVISGVFYLYEDAFRVGEYIETSEGKGVIEKILLRSVRLRHPRGPIYTVPFGSMGTIQNHSRDWVKVKFSFEVAATENLERVRKLVKKVGQQLSEDPEIKDKFIDPLKSQGAVAMVGANYQIGVKFSCPPGEQFLIRRKAFVAIQNAIREHGIQIATPRVIVDSEDKSAHAAAASVALSQAASANAPAAS